MSNVLVVGGNRGIGLELARQLASRGDSVWATCRTPTAELSASKGVVVIDAVDVVAEAGLAKVVDAMREVRLDLLVIAAGVLEANALSPLDVASVQRQFEVNALAPLRFASALCGRIPAGGKIALLTSRMGSIADNGSGGHYGYRMSKAALNAAGKSLSVDLAPRGIAVALLHPGYVRTRMTGDHGLIEADESARLLLRRIDELSMTTSGTFWHSSGEVLPW